MTIPAKGIIPLAMLALAHGAPALADHHHAGPDEGTDWTGFAAAGNEPFWSMTIGEDRFRFEHIGELEVEAPRTAPGFTPGGTVFMSRSEGGTGRDFIVLVEDQVCYDDMSGRPYPKEVRVFVEGRHFAGCGGDTRDLLTGVEWVLTAIGPYRTFQDDGLTIAFDGEGGVSGYGGCNRYMGRYELGEGIDFGPIASTRRACADREATEREHMLLTLFESVVAFEIGDNGELHLMANDGMVIEAVRPLARPAAE